MDPSGRRKPQIQPCSRSESYHQDPFVNSLLGALHNKRVSASKIAKAVPKYGKKKRPQPKDAYLLPRVFQLRPLFKGYDHPRPEYYQSHAKHPSCGYSVAEYGFTTMVFTPAKPEHCVTLNNKPWNNIRQQHAHALENY